MLVSLLDSKSMKTISLPDNPAGRYWFEGYGKAGVWQKILMFEPKDGRWNVRTTAFVRPENLPENAIPPLSPNEWANYPVQIINNAGNFEQATLLAEPSSGNVTAYKKYVVDSGAELLIGRDSQCDIAFGRLFVSGKHAMLSYIDGKWRVMDLNSSNGTYLNEERIPANEWQLVNPGDVVFIVGLRITVGLGFLAINNPGNAISLQSESIGPFVPQQVEPLPVLEDWEEPNEDEDTNLFFRSPRFARSFETRKIRIDTPPDPASGNDMPLIHMIGPSLVMGLAAMSSGMLMAYNIVNSGGSMINAAPMLIMSVSMIIGMVLWPIIANKYQKRKGASEEASRQEKYLRYLARIRDSISKEALNQREILLENKITPEECRRRALYSDRALWERTTEHKDFLTVRLGLGTRPLDCELNYSEERFSLAEDNLLESMYELVSTPIELHNVPVTLSLLENHAVGFIGQRSAVVGLAHNLIAQIVALHSYDEVKLVLLFDDAEMSSWEYVRLLPHIWDNNFETRYFASNINEAQRLSIELERIITQRQEADTLSNDTVQVPHYVVVACSKPIAERCSFVSRVLQDGEEIGFSFVALYDELKLVPKECSMVVSLENEQGRIFDKSDTSGSELLFSLDPFIPNTQMQAIALALGNTFTGVSGQRFELPTTLNFMSMYRAGRVEHLDIATRWRENDPTISIAAPIGVDENGDILSLDLHEKSHGPHGLVAGMTGSGKSECIITLVLSLALNYSPEEVAFVLIDYKGGGLALAFDNERMRLPHLAGTITNLDGAAISRSLISIEAELKRRQTLFNTAREATNEGTMDIYTYQRLYRRGDVDEPLPHLFIISDEFAELKMQQPEFMDQLVSTARIGRSLGVHLILATQKPSGVVNDQIWSNARFKICLKVQDRADSLDMIRRPEAAELIGAGRFYLQVGFNEYFALGQAAWAGAPYHPTDQVLEDRDESIDVIDNLGHVLRKTKPEAETGETQGKQIVRVIEYICESAKNEGLVTRSLWLDPISELIFVDDIIAKHHWKKAPAGRLEAVVGEFDDPGNQRQGLVTIGFSDQGNTLIYGASGSGKAVLCSSLVYSLIANYSPAEVNLYLVDFGTEILRSFEGAPHVGDVVVASDDEKLENLFKLLEKEIANRRKLFAEFGGSIATYVQSTNESIPSIVVVIEGIAVLSEIQEALYDSLARLARDSARYGIYFVVTAENTPSIGFRMAQNFGKVLALRMNDVTEYGAALGEGRAKLLSSFFGAGIIKLDEVLQFQTAHPLHFGDNLAKALRNWCMSTFVAYNGFTAPAIPLLPETVTADLLIQHEIEQPAIPCGISVTSLEPVSFNAYATPCTIVSSESSDSLSSFCLGLYEYLGNWTEVDIVVCDPFEYIDSLLPNNIRLLQGSEAVFDALSKIIEESDTAPSLCVLNDLARFMDELEPEQRGSIESYFALLDSAETHFVIAERESSLSPHRFEPWLSRHIGANGIWLGNGVSDQGVIKLSGFSAALLKSLEDGFGYVVLRGSPRLCKMLSGKRGAHEA